MEHYKIGLRLSVGLSVCEHSHGRIIFLIDFHQNWHRGKASSLEVNISPPIPLFCPQPPILSQEALKTHANIK